jgi:hypothetical protein
MSISADSNIGRVGGRAGVRAWFIQFGVASGGHHADQVAVLNGRYASLTCARK